MRWVSVGLLLISITPASAQKLEDQERLNQFDKAISAIDDLRNLTDKMTNAKRTQCPTAINNRKLCDCLSSNLPVVINFVNYVVLVNKTKDELGYDKQSKEDKAIIDATRRTRDTCAR